MAEASPRKYPFLPADAELGWLPYLWLLYFIQFLIFPYFSHASAFEWAVTAGALAFAVPLYFWGYWLCGYQLLIPSALFLVLGLGFARSNPGAAVFVVYGAAYIGRIGDAERGLQGIGAYLAVLAVASWGLQLPMVFFAPAAAFAIITGLVSIHSRQRRVLNRKLLLAQGEVEQIAKVAERERIARDLHDLLGHTLSVIILKSELASKLADRDLPRALQEIGDVERISREALTQVREAVRGYRVSSFGSELKLAEQALRTAGVVIESDIDTSALPSAQEHVLAFALRECVTNIVRHARANACRIRLRRSGRGYEFEVNDDGVGGLSPEANGLAGMRERVEAMGGTLQRSGDSGTTLRIMLPSGTT